MLDDHAQICGHWPEDAAAPLDDQCPAGQGVIRDWNHHGYVQTERNVRFLADDIVSAWKQIGDGNAVIPLSGDFDVDFRNAWVPGPVRSEERRVGKACVMTCRSRWSPSK